jgi:hypothetical protein
MADSSPLAGLLDRAGHVFDLTWQLGRTFQEERGTGGGLRQIDPRSWSRHQPTFNKFCNAVLDLRDAMQNPPDGFGPVAQALLKSAGVAKTIRDTMQTAAGQTWAEFLDFFPELNSVAAAGREAIQEVTKARRLDDPFAFFQQAKPPHSQHPYLALDRFARTVCNSELADLTSRLPPHPKMTDHRRQEYRNEGERLASQANEFAAQKHIPFREHDQLLRTLGGQIMNVMNLMGRTWWPTNSEEANDTTKELRQRIETCREASLSLLRFAEYHGCPLPKAHPGDGNTPKTWDEVFASLSAWEEQVESSSATNQELADAGGFIERLLAGPEKVELSPHALALLEAHLRQPVSFAVIQQEKKAAGHSPTEAARNKLKLIRDFNLGLQQPKTPPADVPLDQSTMAAGQAMLAHIDSLATTNTTMRSMVVDLGARHAGVAAPGSNQSEAGLIVNPAGRTPKRSTERGEGRAKLIAALTKHHRYADGGCLNLEPIGNNELAKAAGVSTSTASTFFTNEFGGHTRYKALYRDSGRLVAALKLLNNEFSPHDLYGRRPAGEDDRDDERDE